MRNSIILRIFFVLFSMGILSCEFDYSFSIQNCYGDNAKIIIELNEQFNFDTDINEYINENEITLELSYLEVKKIGRTTFREIKNGLPFEKMIIIRPNDTTVINRGDDILPMMDTDVLGQIAKPFVICI